MPKWLNSLELWADLKEPIKRGSYGKRERERSDYTRMDLLHLPTLLEFPVING
jgi:hypothetical protein